MLATQQNILYRRGTHQMPEKMHFDWSNSGCIQACAYYAFKNCFKIKPIMLIILLWCYYADIMLDAFAVLFSILCVPIWLKEVDEN